MRETAPDVPFRTTAITGTAVNGRNAAGTSQNERRATAAGAAEVRPWLRHVRG